MTMFVSSADDPRVQAAQAARSCDICKAPKGKPCMNTILPGKPLPGRVIHFGRLTDRNREPKGDE
ncbi:hypothetical protein SEA_SANDALPHON_73 [Mycobacterium phage Sandalphon]|uniref:DNA-binding phage zinc finger domain-containing protein n=5 Tax=Cheoctovirus TaxID=1623281 RepID=Q19YI0_9CAUD|nr:hypothetical protein BOOMER_80 [Mycobacterium phage Boomer]YP_009957690.1 hypothetical protein I5H43_gp074 [Mycobacterium phage Girr]YP_009959948.1 hypothetical protein I5H65_gp075 [Mycobacterium phage Minnie]YP_009962113.1 hypothetical protein I5H86_gp073 [Mycobacterium phage Sandalphon]YP_655834.1 gp73 [Mycobacterium phage PMC]AXQ65118.1 hypothetical protein SEA_RUBY_72 [Mycobacterium phage Ruby]QAY06143.1 hypothetical protein SEA_MISTERCUDDLES_75 [Mycobacterium phage MisterCuddles]UVK6